MGSIFPLQDVALCMCPCAQCLFSWCVSYLAMSLCTLSPCTVFLDTLCSFYNVPLHKVYLYTVWPFPRVPSHGISLCTCPGMGHTQDELGIAWGQSQLYYAKATLAISIMCPSTGTHRGTLHGGTLHGGDNPGGITPHVPISHRVCQHVSVPARAAVAEAAAGARGLAAVPGCVRGRTGRAGLRHPGRPRAPQRPLLHRLWPPGAVAGGAR